MIKNKLKISLLSLAVLSLVFVGANTVSASSLTWSSDQTIDMSSPDMDLTVASGSTADSLVISTGTITPTLVSGDVFVVSTAAAGSFTFSPLNNVSLACSSSGITTLTITETTGQTYTLTPSTTACVSGGSGGSSAPVITPTPTTPVPPTTPTTGGTNAIGGCDARTTGFSTTTGFSCIGNTGTIPATPATPATPSMGCSAGPTYYNFGTTTLKNGSKGEAVKELQRFLNRCLSLGLVVDGFLGPKTIAVIKKWQTDNGLVSDGLVGKLTKAKINAWAASH